MKMNELAAIFLSRGVVWQLESYVVVRKEAHPTLSIGSLLFHALGLGHQFVYSCSPFCLLYFFRVSPISPWEASLNDSKRERAI